MPDLFRFVGAPHYLGLAAAELGQSVAAIDEARRLPSLTRLSNLIAQACDADAQHAPGILAEARKSYDALAVGARAAAMALEDAHKALRVEMPPLATAPAPAPKPKGR